MKINIKKRSLIRVLGILAAIIFIAIFPTQAGTVWASEESKAYQELDATLNAQQKLQLQSIRGAYINRGEDYSWDVFLAYNNIPSSVVQFMVTYHHAWGSHIDELKEMGYTDVDYSAVQGTTSTEQPATVPSEPVQDTAPAEQTDTEESQQTQASSEPVRAEFRVTPIDPPITMWAVSEVNYRDGADTTYNKIGALAKGEAVTVTGKASTGWYQFVKDGVDVYLYVSDKYLTDTDPNAASEPEPAEAEATETSTEAVETESTVSEELETQETASEAAEEASEPGTVGNTSTELQEQTEMPQEMESSSSFNWWILVGAATALIAIAVAAVIVMKKKS